MRLSVRPRVVAGDHISISIEDKERNLHLQAEQTPFAH